MRRRMAGDRLGQTARLPEPTGLFAPPDLTLGSGRDLLARATARALAWNHHTLDEQLGAPHAPRLAPLDGSGQARGAHWAISTHGLGSLDVLGRLGEEQLRVDRETWDLQRPAQRLGENTVEWAGQHLRHPLVTS